MRFLHFFRDEMDKSVDGWVDGYMGGCEVSIDERLHRRLVAVKCSTLLADTKRGSQESFQTSPLLARDYSLGCYPIML